jgi:hypothetical protein
MWLKLFFVLSLSTLNQILGNLSKIASKIIDLFVKTLKICTMGQNLKKRARIFLNLRFWNPHLNRNNNLGGLIP